MTALADSKLSPALSKPIIPCRFYIYKRSSVTIRKTWVSQDAQQHQLYLHFPSSLTFTDNERKIWSHQNTEREIIWTHKRMIIYIWWWLYMKYKFGNVQNINHFMDSYHLIDLELTTTIYSPKWLEMIFEWMLQFCTHFSAWRHLLEWIAHSVDSWGRKMHCGSQCIRWEASRQRGDQWSRECWKRLVRLCTRPNWTKWKWIHQNWKRQHSSGWR